MNLEAKVDLTEPEIIALYGGKRILTLKEAAEHLGVSLESLRGYRYRGTLNIFTKVAGRLRVDTLKLERALLEGAKQDE